MENEALTRLASVLASGQMKWAFEQDRLRSEIAAQRRYLNAFVAAANKVIVPALREVSDALRQAGRSEYLQISQSADAESASIRVSLHGLKDEMDFVARLTRPQIVFRCDSSNRIVRITKGELDLRTRMPRGDTRFKLHQLSKARVQHLAVDLLEQVLAPP